MRGFSILIAALMAPATALAHSDEATSPYPAPADGLSDEQRAAAAGVDAFFDALRSDDKTALSRTMVAEGLIFIHNRMDPENPQVMQRTISDHLESWLSSPTGLDEFMNYDAILVDGDMAQVWGPYSFHAGGEVTHCGINSMSLVKGEDGSWKVGNTSFSMVPPAQCTAVGADWVDGDDS